MGLGSAINKLTGASNSAKQNFRYQEKLANLNFAHQKEFAQNAHQWEMADLEKAGLNPALTTGASSAGSIAGGGSTGGGSGVGSSAMNPMNLISGIVGMKNQTNQTNANAELARAQALATIEMLPINKKEKEQYVKLLGAQTAKTKGSKEGIIGNIMQQGMLSTLKSSAKWFLK